MLEDGSYDVIGVLAPEFAAYPEADIWIPLQADPNGFDHRLRVRVAARLLPRITIDSARRQIMMTQARFMNGSPSSWARVKSTA